MISIIIQTLLISVSVAMDAFAVSIGKGLTVTRVRYRDAVKTALWFGGFQALFPVLGYFAASTFSSYVTSFDHWIIFGLLVFIGGNMIHEAFEEDEENARETAQFDWKHMLPLAVACSIDAFAVGVSLAFMKTNMVFAIASIGIVTGLFSAAGLYIGRAFGARWQKPAQIAGGVVLILIGVKVLLEHMGIIAF
ncbi:manganese efflux pump MntP family protein [Bifidobacterium sp. UTBIF-78]|uniref:manganese efflux pump MntP n=1 Tax=Bifidobacterium sp. UTBIF-78 TaxID=1465263 RepID=UPI00112B9199|nr:manganese efflux pump MntP family protein [Bifidobacterium sp. UTBIF-78]TPF93938.1 membrane protein [Bifidobacterium sp. UTBIF-78]